jgi:hypothetical protein
MQYAGSPRGQVQCREATEQAARALIPSGSLERTPTRRLPPPTATIQPKDDPTTVIFRSHHLISSFFTMSEPGPSAAESTADMFPALYLYPREDSFDIPKHLSLAGGQRIRIGRQTNNKTVPTQRNSFFKSKVVARKHAEIWEQHGKVSVCSLSPRYTIASAYSALYPTQDR